MQGYVVRYREFVPRSLEPTEAPFCANCGTSMWVVRVERDIELDHRTYECPGCYRATTIAIRHPNSSFAL